MCRQHGRNRFLTLILFVTVLVSAITLPLKVNAQSDETLERIDQAMAHLSEFLGETVTRDSSIWSYAEVIYPDSSLDCPVTGQTYIQQQILGYRVRIEAAGSEYDYRFNTDGSILVLCLDGLPHPSSIGIEIPDNPFEESIDVDNLAIQPLPPSEWWAWVYGIETDTLFLISPNGEQLRLLRPHLPNEAPNADPKLSLTRDGRYLIITAQLSTGNAGIGFYSIQDGSFIRTHEARINEQIYLGFGYDGSSISGSPYIADPSNQYIAIGLASTDFTNPTWRIVVFDVATGDPLYQLEQNSPQIVALGDSYAGLDGIYFPRILYFDMDAVHVQLIRFASGGAESYPAFTWHPNGNFVEVSPFNLDDIDILSTDETPVFTYLDNSAAALPANGPFVSHNAIGIGLPVDSTQRIYLDGNFYLSLPRWAGSGDTVLFNSADQNNRQQWNGVSVNTGVPFTLDASVQAVYGTVNGFLARSTDGAVTFTNSTTIDSPTPIWQAPAGAQILFLWSNPAGSTFIPTSVAVPLSVTGVVNCPGTPVSNVAVGSLAQVVDEESSSTLRLRATAGGELLFSMQPGTEFVVVGGPQCQGDYTWWQLQLDDGTLGWAAEAASGLYLIEPVPETE